MKKQLWKILLFAVIFGGIADTAFAQQKKKKGPKKRSSTKRTTKTKTKAKIQIHFLLKKWQNPFALMRL